MEETVKSCVLEVLNLTKLWTLPSKMLEGWLRKKENLCRIESSEKY